ncbi:MAG: ABC transporter ATP-binding protein [Chloroflexota bacterium]
MIEASRLEKVYEGHHAVKGINFEVKRGELMALLGPNGAGKTSTIRMVSSILKPSAGSVVVNGANSATEPDKVRRSIGMITEQPGLYERMTGMEYLLFYGRLYGLRDRHIRNRGQSLFKRFGMNGAIDSRLGTYSKGMKQKAGLIRAMLHNPPVLLLDEPTSAMDPHSAKQVREAIQELRDDHHTIILCTHNLNEAERLSDSIAIINNGEIVAKGGNAELKQQLLGDPVMEVTLNLPIKEKFQSLQSRIPSVEFNRISGNVIRYQTDSPISFNPYLIQVLSQLSIGVVTLREVSQSLEEVYLSVVNEEPLKI